MKTTFLIILTCLFLTSCSREPSHIPSVLSLPKALVTNTIENSVYNAKRRKVKEYVVANYDGLKLEIKNGEGAHLGELLSKANVQDTESTKKQLQRDYEVMFENVDLMTESMINKYSFIYISQSREKLKTINGFTYTQASKIISSYLNKNMNDFESALREKNSRNIQSLVDELNIQESDRRKIFLDFILEQHENYFIEPVVVGVMVAQ